MSAAPYLCDQHTHSRFSFDGHHEPDALCEAALDAGISELAITDHYDIDGVLDGFYTDYDAPAARDAVYAAAEKYAGRLRVVYGVELGQPMNRAAQAREFLDKNPFDFVIGSLHNLRGVPDFCYLNYEKMSDTLIETLFRRSLAELREVAVFDGISTLAHITYPYRYVRRCGRELDFGKFTDEIASLYRLIIERGVALEVNVSTLRDGFTMPTTELLKLYRECGGEMVTVGTDSHYAEKIGFGIAQTYRLLYDLGFRYITVFRGRKPEYIKL